MTEHLPRYSAVIAAVVGLCCPGLAGAQTPAPSVGLSWGVDTTITEVRDVVRLTREYLTHPDTTARSRGLWSTKSPFDARYGDLASETYQGFPATILGVTGTGPGDSLYVVRVIHASVDSADRSVHPMALERFYAVRAPGSPYGWQLSSPLPRLTGQWPHHDVGRITFWYAPGQRQSRAKAIQASQFVDSVARLFAVAPPDHLDAYIAGTMEEAGRLLGLDFFVENSGPGTGLGGRGGGAAPILLLANPALGEAYFHELVHAVLSPTLRPGNSIFGEGVATWLGGSSGHSLKELYAVLHEYQQRYPAVSMMDLLGGDVPGGNDATNALYATRALIVDSVYRRGGIAGLKQFAKLQGSPTDIVKALPEYATGVGADVNQWWRAETDAALKR